MLPRRTPLRLLGPARLLRPDRVACALTRLALIPALLLFVFAPLRSTAEDFQGSTHQVPYDDEVIKYTGEPSNDPVAQLAKKIESGEVKLPWDEKFGYLPGLLDLLHVPKSSQTLVFSKTSVQRSEITPSNPRSLFFNDDVYLGYIPGAPVMEVSAVDPKLGGVFYSLEQEKVRKPKFTRESDCLRCHSGPRSLGVPGHLMRSIGTDLTGELDALTEIEGIDHCTPLADRWAGWYVTGQLGGQTHRGNLVGPEAFARHAQDPSYLASLNDLSCFFDPSKYLMPGSDVVALMVLEHQAHMHNYITRLNYEARIMLSMYGHIRYLKHQEDAFLRCLLFTEEAPLTAAISGNPEFTRAFAAPGPRDHLGRSLRDFDLQTRIFLHPCSFLIYTASFDSLPAPIHDHLLERLYAILTGADEDPQFARRTPEERQAILEILRETKPGLPAYWNQKAS